VERPPPLDKMNATSVNTCVITRPSEQKFQRRTSMAYFRIKVAESKKQQKKGKVYGISAKDKQEAEEWGKRQAKQYGWANAFVALL